MKRTLIIVTILFTLLVSSLAEAQVPTPPDVPTLGPVIIGSAGDSGNFVKITSLENQTKYQNPIQLKFNIQEITLLGQFYNVGYSIDGGIVNNAGNFVSRSIDNSGSTGGYYKSIAIGSLSLPTLSEGSHRITVYAGWQYLGIPERFEVTAYSTVEFIVGNPESTSPAPTQTPSTSYTPLPIISPTPSQSMPTISTGPTLPVELNPPIVYIILAVVIVIAAIASVFLVFFKRRKSKPA
jgi:hypothetical protein